MKRDPIAVISHNSPAILDKSLNDEGFRVLRIPPSSHLSSPTDAHTDMLIFALDNTVFCHESYACDAKKELEYLAHEGLDIKTVGGMYAPSYPHDILLNIAKVGKTLLIGKKSHSGEICEYAKANGYSVLTVNQGYAKCSTCIVSDNAIITADESIASTAENAGISVLLISKGDVLLPPYEYGFIGGASGSYGDTVYFVGDIDTHPYADKIKAFCFAHKKQVISLCNGALTDIGSILFI